MIDLERRLEARFPHWFRGHRARLARPLLRGFGRLSRLDEAEAFLARHGHLRGQAFIEAALAHLGVSTLLDPTERERVPEAGALLVVANHPCGALDALALLKGLPKGPSPEKLQLVMPRALECLSRDVSGQHVEPQGTLVADLGFDKPKRQDLRPLGPCAPRQVVHGVILDSLESLLLFEGIQLIDGQALFPAHALDALERLQPVLAGATAGFLFKSAVA